ncbi:MAG: tRNA pseudouridine(54/55) synthase Pus10 [Thermoplasmata archaeon]
MPVCSACIERLGIEGSAEQGKCEYCGGLLQHVQEFFDMFIAATEGYEFRTFLIGVKADEDALSRDLKIMQETKRDCRNFKKEFEYRLGSRIEKDMNLRADFSQPDVVFTVNQRTMSYDIWVRPVFVGGRYLKKARGIPQSPWISPAPGRVGKSISEFIGEAAAVLLEGRDYVFYASGREDVDALMLGDGRPFYVEVIQPKKRSLDSEELRKRIQEESEGRVDVLDAKILGSEEVNALKSMRPNKVYEVKFTMDGNVDRHVLEKLKSYSGICISQRTPSRVLPIRRDIVRKRRIESLNVIEHSGSSVTIIVEAEAGTYVKEFITGDSGRTEPSISGDLKVNVKIDYLNVLRVK